MRHPFVNSGRDRRYLTFRQVRKRQGLQHGLESERFDVTVASTGEDGFFLVSSQMFDLLILDLMLPGRDGLEILRTVRQRGLATPVIILSARDTVEDRIRGLDQGAADYLVKPFAFEEQLPRRSVREGPQTQFFATRGP